MWVYFNMAKAALSQDSALASYLPKESNAAAL